MVQKKRKGRPFLKILLLLIFLVSLFFLLTPVLPQVGYWLKYDLFRYDWKEMNIPGEPGSTDGEDVNELEANKILIPVIGIDVAIVEGESDEALNRGAWHRPGTGNPVDGGNMVITGHRFQYLPPNNTTFYHLDKLKEGDGVIVYWNKIEYDYLVSEVFVVEPESIEIEEETANHLLTLYTCTPLWTAKQRLVVRAELTD